MIFDDNVDVVLGSEGAQLVKAVGDEFRGFFRSSISVGIDPNRMAAKGFGGSDPTLVVIDGFEPIFFVCRSDLAFAIDHDEHICHTEVFDSLVQVSEVGLVLGFVFEELVNVF